ncbi:hypothetical protein DL93DRAFT_2100091 [Clavulina sp. PMI_390]|nr:hypothetical protein DL93DRAFT_2100091 [Clavulina sp. PMI_390]
MGYSPNPTFFVAASIVSSMLTGVLTVQTYHCLVRYPKDSPWFKGMIVSLWALDMLHQAFACFDVYHLTIAQFVDSKNANHVPWFFCWRLYALNRVYRPLVWLGRYLRSVRISNTVLVREPSVDGYVLDCRPVFNSAAFGLGNSIVESVQIHPRSNGKKLIDPYESCSIISFNTDGGNGVELRTVFARLWLITCAIVEVGITLAIAYSLWSSRSGIKSVLIRESTVMDSRTNQLINKLLLWTVNTGMVPAIFAVAELFLFDKARTASIGLDTILAKLYSNSLVASLNRRYSPLDGRYRSTRTEDLDGIRLSTDVGAVAHIHQHSPRSGTRRNSDLRFAVSSPSSNWGDRSRADSPEEPISTHTRTASSHGGDTRIRVPTPRGIQVVVRVEEEQRRDSGYQIHDPGPGSDLQSPNTTTPMTPTSTTKLTHKQAADALTST